MIQNKSNNFVEWERLGFGQITHDYYYDNKYRLGSTSLCTNNARMLN